MHRGNREARWRRRALFAGIGILAIGASRTQLFARFRRSLIAEISDNAWRFPLLPAFIQRGWRRRTELFASYEMRSGDVIMLGDSITEMADWSSLLPGVRVHNQGIGGDDSDGVLRRLDLVTQSKPGQVFLMIGTNDLGKGSRTVEQIAANVAETLEGIRAGSPTTQIYLQSVLPRLRRRADQVRDLNRALEEVARTHDAEWIDLWPVFDRGDGEVKAELAFDALHPTADGYRAWVAVIATRAGGTVTT